MQHIEVSVFREQTTEILRNVREARAEYIVTYHGEPMAQLVPVENGREETPVTDFEQKSRLMNDHAHEIERFLAKDKQLPPQNRQALELLQDWLLDYQPEDDAIMDEFDKLLTTHPFTLETEEVTETED
jgi:prevent-host-death family protein